MSAPATSVDAQPIPRGISIREFARSQGVSEATIRRRVGTGEIPSYKVVGSRRIPLSYLEELQQGEAKPVPNETSDEDDSVESAIDRIVAAAPDFTDDQRNRISALLRTGGAR